jgi:ATP-binding cassette, subfamily B, bacterial MsbA
MTANKFLIDLGKKEPLFIVSSTILSLSSAIFNGVSTALLIPILVVFLGDGNFTNIPQKPAILKDFFTFFDRFEGDSKIIILIGLVIGAIVLKNATNYLNLWLSNYYTKVLLNNMRFQGFSLLCEVSLDYYAQNKVGDIMIRINREIERTTAALRNLQKILTISVTILTFTYFLLLISIPLTLITTILLGLIAISNQYFVIKSKKLGKILAQNSKEYSRKVLEFLMGIRLIKTVANEAEEYRIIKSLIETREKAQLESQSISGIINPINEIFGIVMILGLIIVSRYLFAEQLKVFAPILLTYLVVLFRLLPFIGQLNNARTQLANNIASAEIVADFLRRDNKPFLSKGHLQYTRLKSSIKFEGVSFAYPNHQQLVLDNIDLDIPKGKTIALVGGSGAGKSTIADLLPRFYDPTQGRIIIDGQNLKDYEIESFRKAMGVVSQDTFLFNNTVTYNIAYGLKNVTETEIITAAKRANAYEFINQLPKGFDTEVGDRGVMLSGGQRQRLAIARALLRNPDILILDEATSALDTVSERLVQEAIEELCRDRTTLVIAHRLSTIRNAHQIVVLDKGKIVEIGNHNELLAKNNLYARLHAMQFQDKSQDEVAPITQKIASKLLRHTNVNLSHKIRNDLNSLIGSLQLITDGLVEDIEEQDLVMNEAYQAAKNMLNALEEYEAEILSKSLS